MKNVFNCYCWYRKIVYPRKCIEEFSVFCSCCCCCCFPFFLENKYEFLSKNIYWCNGRNDVITMGTDEFVVCTINLAIFFTSKCCLRKWSLNWNYERNLFSNNPITLKTHKKLYFFSNDNKYLELLIFISEGLHPLK